MSNLPKYHAYTVKDRGEGKKSIWTRIGSAWPHDNGNGLNIEIEALPLSFDGKIVLMTPKTASQASDTFEAEVG